MGEAKAIAEATEKRRQKKISFMREHVPSFYGAILISGNLVKPGDVLDDVSVLFELLEGRCVDIANGEEE